MGVFRWVMSSEVYMDTLIVLMFEKGEPVRCESLREARQRASASDRGAGRVFVEVVPEGGGPVLTLEYDRRASDWIPYDDDRIR